MDSIYLIKFSAFCATRTYYSLFLAITISTIASFYSVLIDDLIVPNIATQINLTNTQNKYYQSWIRPENGLDFNVYIFNLTNTNEFLDNCENLKLTQKGPYSFRITSGREVFNHSLYNGMPTINFFDFKEYQHNPEKTTGNYTEDIFNTIDIPTLVINDQLNKAIGDSWFISGFLSVQFNDDLFAPIKVDELLFKGKHVELLAYLQSLWSTYYSGEPFPGVKLKDNLFSLFNEFNVTFMGPYEIYSEGSKLNNFISWQNSPTMKYWFGEKCNHVEGTDGNFFPPFLRRDQILTIFIPPLCRKFNFIYENDVTLLGMNLYRYRLSKDAFNSGQTSPENSCYCNSSLFNDLDEGDSEETNFNVDCSVDGVTDMHNCMKEAPIWLSTPHFYNSPLDESTLKVEGLKADPEIHGSFLDIEPTLGLPLRANIRFQINVALRKQTFITSRQEIKCNRLLPVIWFEYTGVISAEEADKSIRNVVITLARIEKSKPYFTTMAIIFIIISVTLGYCKYNQNYILKIHLKLNESHKIVKSTNAIISDNNTGKNKGQLKVSEEDRIKNIINDRLTTISAESPKNQSTITNKGASKDLSQDKAENFKTSQSKDNVKDSKDQHGNQPKEQAKVLKK